MIGREVFTDRLSLPPGVMTELAALRDALPGYDVIVTSNSRAYRYEAIRRADSPGPWCVISSDPADLWQELVSCIRPDIPVPADGQPSPRHPAGS